MRGSTAHYNTSIRIQFIVQGVTRNRFEELRTEIIHCLAFVEALIDFGEGEDIEEGVYEQGTCGPADLMSSLLIIEPL